MAILRIFPADAKRRTLSALSQMLPIERVRAGKVGLRLWDGTLWPDAAPRPTTVVLKHPGVLRALLRPPLGLSLGEAFLRDDLDIEGCAEDVASLFGMLEASSLKWGQKARIARDVLRLPALPRAAPHGRAPARLSGKRHSPERNRQAVAYHYNASNEFYALWLDTGMVYSCAYFEHPGDDLETAQARKLDFICRKLRLRPGQKLLDIGCGWGALIIHAALHYGVEATGITLSGLQVEHAEKRIAEAGLEGQCRVLLRDYREMNERESFDALVSVGMFEHVGAALLPAYFEQAWGLLKTGGVFLNHGIATNAEHRPLSGPNFIDTYVFPDGETVPLNHTLQAAEESGFEVRDVESLREHYALTLRHWVRRLEANHETAARLVGEAGYRVWRLYMSGSAFGFTSRRLNLYQTLLVKNAANGENSLPLTRAAWYV